MFGRCVRCDTLVEERNYLRQQVAQMTKALTAMADAKAYAATQFEPGADETYVGAGGCEDYVEHDQWGNEVVVTKATHRRVMDDEPV